ncbi:MAG TPA: GNAT family N-acetyltransferase [Candidatus Cloacimonadota bacterium]|nr:GNAT family N-acetyltransferase [Candidatus Cloacimonadota bacterium]HPT71310.1 GNAT family N-acetyltransferase [Candidatus Cloacimonadota bacterium]
MALKDAFQKFPVLTTERLILRQLADSDAEAFYELYSEPEVPKFLDWDGPGSVDVARMIIEYFNEQYRKRETIRWAVVSKETDKLIGTCILCGFWRNSIADIGYDLAKSEWGKGYMQEALKAILKWADDDLNFHRIQAQVRPENQPSQKLLNRLGFVEEGLVHMGGFHETRKFFYDYLLFSRVRTPTEYNAKQV